MVSIAAVVVLVANIITMPPNIRSLPTLRVLLYPQVGGVAIIGVLTFFAALRRELLVWDVLVVGLVGLIATIQADIPNLTGFTFVMLSLLIAWQYGYLVKKTRLKLAVALGLYAAAAVASVFLQESINPGGVVIIGLAAVVVSIIIWMVLVREVNRDRQRAAELEKTVTARTTELDEALQTQKHLLREVHHRTKNNLQIVSSILSLEWNREGAPASDAALKHTQTRLQALAETHDVLYTRTPEKLTDFAAFVEDYVGRMMRNGGVGSAVDTDVHFNADVPLDWAIRTALLINELILQVVNAEPGSNARRTIRLVANEENETAVISIDGPIDNRSLQFVQAVASGMTGTAQIAEGGEYLRVEIPLPEDADNIREF